MEQEKFFDISLGDLKLPLEFEDEESRKSFMKLSPEEREELFMGLFEDLSKNMNAPLV